MFSSFRNVNGCSYLLCDFPQSVQEMYYFLNVSHVSFLLHPLQIIIRSNSTIRCFIA
jgi:hypothetical protein